ncbi:glycoside hydrolase family 3 protein [Moniliophthora roreri]|nr:glycoside hydrolase family 3 protein [Moniliophthora roreri]
MRACSISLALFANTLFLVVEGARFPDCISGPLADILVCDPNASSIDCARALIAELTVSELIENMDTSSPGVSRFGLASYTWHCMAWLLATASLASPGQDFSYATSFPVANYHRCYV